MAKEAENKKFLHVCEVCGKEEMLTADEAFEAGWDYPPHIGTFGVVSPRTCPDCCMVNTAWYAMQCEKKALDELSEKQKMAILRILKEEKI